MKKVLRGLAALLLLAAAVVEISGCSGASQTKSAAISVTDPTGVVTGQLRSLTVGQIASVSMNPAADPANAGVDWTVTCGGSPVTGSLTGGACGILSPLHTPNGVAANYSAPAAAPLGGTVTITAAVTSDPSSTGSVTLPITPLPISISLTNPSPTLGVGASLNLFANIVNDVTLQGTTWTVTCKSTACGTVSPTATFNNGNVVYTAPSSTPTGGTVTITETSVADPTKSASVTIAIPSVTISVSPAVLYVQTGGQYERGFLVANLANDTAGKGVTWSANCASPCGVSPSASLSGQQVAFLGPKTAPAGDITITATSVAEPTVSVSVTAKAITTTPIQVTMTTVPPAKVLQGNTVSLAATVANDPANTGVVWSAACASAPLCGSFNSAPNGLTTVYTAPTAVPTGGGVTITASSLSTSPSNSAIAATVITAPAPPVPTIAITQQPAATLLPNAQTPVTAVVTNDVPPGGVTWTVTCTNTNPGACGSVSPYRTASGNSATYTAPPVNPGVPVTIVATSTSASSATAFSNAVTISSSPLPLSVGFVPYAPTQITAGTSVNLNAAVANDATKGGVDWAVCPGSCGFFTIKPAIAAIPGTATTPYVPAVAAVTATTVPGWSNGLPILYTAPAAPPASGPITVTATAHADGTTAAVASVNISPSGTGPALQGIVQAGIQPVIGSRVALYAAGSSGAGSASTLLYAPDINPTVTTDATGHFTVPAGYTCPAVNSQVYLVAAGGHVGSYGPNPALTLVTALGSCGALASTPVVLNEVTTVASAYALSHFVANDEYTGNISYLNIGSNSSTAAAMSNAFAAVSNLVDVTTGEARFTVPSGNATVPFAEINSLADVLNTCTNSPGGTAGDGSPCGTLLAYTDSLNHSVYTAYSPADTFQAVVNIAFRPMSSGNTGYGTSPLNIYSLVSAAGPFQPVLSASPTDWSMALNFTGTGGLTSTSDAEYFSIDASGNLWITDTANNRVVEWNNQGAAMTPAAGFTTSTLTSPQAIAVDVSGNTWICGKNGLTELSSLGIEVPGSPFTGGGLTGSCQGLAIDGMSNLWAINSTSVSEFNGLGVPLSSPTGIVIPTSTLNSTPVNMARPIAIDNSNNIWLGTVNVASGYSSSLSLAELNPNGGTPNLLQPIAPSNFQPSYTFQAPGYDTTQSQIAVDASGRIFVDGNSGPDSFLPYAGVNTTLSPGPSFDSFDSSVRFTPNGMAIDGQGRLFMYNIATTSLYGYAQPIGVMSYFPTDIVDMYFSPAPPGNTTRPWSIAIDSSGNVWVLMGDNTITEYMGLATPVVTPMSLAVKNKKLGATP